MPCPVCGKEMRTKANHSITPNQSIRDICITHNITLPRCRTTAEEILRRPQLSWTQFSFLFNVPSYDQAVIEQVCTDIRYAGYLEREKRKATHTQKADKIKIPPELSFDIPGISFEVAERLTKARPPTLGAASRLPGITPAAIDTLALYLAKRASS